MEPIVLAGPVEFSPAELALIFGVLAALFVALMTPGWAVLAVAMHRRGRARRPGPAWRSAVLGAGGGLGICVAASGLVGSVLQGAGRAGVIAGTLAAWGTCWAVAYALAPRSGSLRPADGPAMLPAVPPGRVDSQPSDEGWGR